MPSSALKTCSLFNWQEHLEMIVVFLCTALIKGLVSISLLFSWPIMLHVRTFCFKQNAHLEGSSWYTYCSEMFLVTGNV